MKALRPLSSLFLAALLGLAVGCTSSSPSEPGNGPAPTPKPPDPPPTVVTFDISVTANPSELAVGSGTPSTITVTVRRADNGQIPADGTNVALATTLGAFGSASGPSNTTLQLVGGRAQAALFATDSAGTATVRASLESSAGAASVRIAVPGTFFVSGVTPSTGGLAGGETIDILGGGFDPPVAVRIGAADAAVLSVTPTRIRVETPTALAAVGENVPAGESRVTNIQVRINVNEPNTQTTTLTNAFTFAAGGGGSQPRIFSLSPTSGSNDGGTRVTINGEGFSQPLQVLFGTGGSGAFNGIEATVQSVTPNQIVVLTPPARGFGQDLLNQLVNVMVRNLTTGANSVSSSAYRFGSNVLITAMGPGSGDYRGGTRVTISGSGFDDPVAVSLGGVGQFVNNVSGTQIVFTTSGIVVTTCPTSGLQQVSGLRVVNIETGDFDEADLSFNYLVPLPRIFSVSPNSGSIGTNTTITGTNFAPNVQVIFGDPTSGSSASIVSINAPTSVTVRVPTPPAGFAYRQEPCGTTGMRNAPTPINITVRNLDSPGCVITFTNGYLVNPPDTTCTGDTPPTTQCNDGFDNDSDGFIDENDPQCTGATDNSEST